jgi:TolA-binding protein
MVKIKSFGIMSAIFAAAVFSGCSHITVLRIQELREVQTRVDSLKAEISSAQSEMREEQKRQSELLRLIRADQQVRFGQVENEISSLSSSINDSQDKLSRISEQTQEIKKRWEEKAFADSQAVVSRNSEIDNLFDVAYKDFMAGRFDVAMSGFDDIISRFPDHPVYESAIYWKGECCYANKAYEEAEKVFISYIKNYPAGNKICGALFKLGLVYEGAKKTKPRNMVWEKLVKQCPDSEEAEAVKQRM